MWEEFHWQVLALLFLLTVVLGIVGFRQAIPNETAADHVYRTLQLFVLEYSLEYSDVPRPIPWELDVARFLAPVIAFSAAIQALSVVFRDQAQALRVRFWRQHTVVCGLGDKGVLLARSFRGRGERVVAIEQDVENRHISLCRSEGVPVFVGDAMSPSLQRRARVSHARYLLAVCGDDATNAHTAEQARELRRKTVVTAAVHVVSQELCDLLAEGQFSAGRGEQFRLEFFNIFERGAQVWLTEHPPFRGGDHLVVVGLGELGRALVVGAGRSWLAENPQGAGAPRLTLVDPLADLKAATLRIHYPQLAELCELVPVPLDVTSSEFERGAFLDPLPSAVYVCLENDQLALTSALALYQRVRGRGVPIVVGASGTGIPSDLVRRFEHLHSFELLERTCTASVLLSGTRNEIIARAMHDEYVRKQREEGSTPETNASMVSWDALPESLRESNRRQADHIPIKLKALGCGLAPRTDWGAPLLELTPGEVERVARMEHDRWRAERILDGWTYEPGEKDVSRKATPWLVPWEEMPEIQREYDRTMVRNLPTFLAGTGLSMYRVAETPSVPDVD